jgi:hypothetical protein
VPRLVRIHSDELEDIQSAVSTQLSCCVMLCYVMFCCLRLTCSRPAKCWPQLRGVCAPRLPCSHKVLKVTAPACATCITAAAECG